MNENKSRMIQTLLANEVIQVEASARKDQAADEKENSHTIGKAGPLNFSPSGGVSTDDPSRSEGMSSFPSPFSESPNLRPDSLHASKDRKDHIR